VVFDMSDGFISDGTVIAFDRVGYYSADKGETLHNFFFFGD